MLNLQIDDTQLQRLALDFVATEKQIDRALKSTHGKMAKWVRTRTQRGLAKELKMPSRVVRRRIKIQKSTPDGVTIFYGENPVGMIHLKAKDRRPSGVTAGSFKRGSAFIAKGTDKKQHVFERTGKARLPIKSQEIEVKDKTDAYLENDFINRADFAAQFYKVFEHELKWQTR